MSATRPGWKRGPAISAGPHILLAGHGAPRHAAAQASILAHAAALAGATGATVRAGFLAAEPSLAESAAAFDDAPISVLPMFMADGYLVRSAVPRALGRPARILRPLGLMPRLAEVIAARALACCAASGIVPARSTLLLLGHGSAHGDASRQAVSSQAERVAGTALFGSVEIAFLKESPRLDEQFRRCCGDVVVMGFFAAPGAHAIDDVPDLMAGASTCGNRTLAYAGAVGADPGIVPLLADAIVEAP